MILYLLFFTITLAVRDAPVLLAAVTTRVLVPLCPFTGETVIHDDEQDASQVMLDVMEILLDSPAALTDNDELVTFSEGENAAWVTDIVFVRLYCVFLIWIVAVRELVVVFSFVVTFKVVSPLAP